MKQSVGIPKERAESRGFIVKNLESDSGGKKGERLICVKQEIINYQIIYKTCSVVETGLSFDNLFNLQL